MKHLLVSILAIFAVLCAGAQELKYTEASDLTMIGKAFDTPNPYHRVDTVKYNKFVPIENLLMRQTTGLAVAFKTNATSITMNVDYGYNAICSYTNNLASFGFDLYIKKDGQWLWASGATPSYESMDRPFRLIADMAEGEKECLLYLPIYAELYSAKIGIPEASYIAPIENPFKGKVALFGSSFTHGISVSRPGLTYPAQLSRSVGIHILSFACSGSCTLQEYFAQLLCDCDADAFVFDAFSNPGPETMKKRLFPFIEKLQAAHPGKPLIFQETIYREWRNFDTREDKAEIRKKEVCDSLMKIACKKYKDVYYIHPNATGPLHETSVDGTHPNDYGYYLWAKSIEKPIMKILRKYGIK